MSVRFLKKYGPYNEGETATFTEDREKDMVKRGIAASVVIPPKRQPTTEEDDLAKKDGGDGSKKNPEGPQNRQTTGTSSKQK